MIFWLGFIVGLWIGGSVGIITMALFMGARDCDENYYASKTGDELDE